MIRYVKQQNKYSCGPIAIINAIKWSGHKFAMKANLRLVIRASGCEKILGCRRSRCFDHALRVFGDKKFKVKLKICPSIRFIENHLRQPGTAIIVNISRFDNHKVLQGHYILITKVSRSGKSFIVINYFTGETRSLIKRSILINDCRRRKSVRIHPVVWFLTKLE